MSCCTWRTTRPTSGWWNASWPAEAAGQRLGELQAALAAGDADTIGRVAHGLKGTSANYGAHELPDLCDRWACRLRAAAELVVRVVEEFEQVAAALRQEFPYPEG